MPELPEVETTRTAIEPFLVGICIKEVHIRDSRLRWPIPADLPLKLCHTPIESVTRRGKYLLVTNKRGTAIIHLGMSGRLCTLATPSAAGKHDHVDLVLSNGGCLRYTDPRRFGCWLWTEGDPLAHPLLKKLGPEPLSPAFSTDYFQRILSRHRVNIKQAIMNSHLVVGVGNIYANEALFAAKIHPLRAANSLSHEECRVLVKSIRAILRKAILLGGTTLKDFQHSDGKPGYFQQQLFVYGRGGLGCDTCYRPLEEKRINGRSTVFCKECQE